MIIRLTNRLSRKIHTGDLTHAPLDENPCADWSARLFIADRTQYILLCNTASLYSVVFYGRGITHEGQFIDRALDSIREAMDYDGRGLIYLHFIAPDTGMVRFCKTLNRSVTGSMNQLEARAKWILGGGELSPFDLGYWLNETVLAAIGTKESRYVTPRDAFMNL